MHCFYGHVIVPLWGYATVILVVLVVCQAHWWCENVHTAIFAARQLRFCATCRAIADQGHECKPQPVRMG